MIYIELILQLKKELVTIGIAGVISARENQRLKTIYKELIHLNKISNEFLKLKKLLSNLIETGNVNIFIETINSTNAILYTDF